MVCSVPKADVASIYLHQPVGSRSKEIAKSNKNVIAAEFHSDAGTAGARFIVDGNEIFFPSVDYWDLKGFVEGVLSA